MEPKTLYIREFEGRMTCLVCVSEPVDTSGASFTGKMLAKAGTNGNSKYWFPDEQYWLVNEQTIFSLPGTSYRVATDEDLLMIFRNWCTGVSLPSREAWLSKLTTANLKKSELKRLAHLLAAEVHNMHG